MAEDDPCCFSLILCGTRCFETLVLIGIAAWLVVRSLEAGKGD